MTPKRRSVVKVCGPAVRLHDLQRVDIPDSKISHDVQCHVSSKFRYHPWPHGGAAQLASQPRYHRLARRCCAPPACHCRRVSRPVAETFVQESTLCSCRHGPRPSLPSSCVTSPPKAFSIGACESNSLNNIPSTANVPFLNAARTDSVRIFAPGRHAVSHRCPLVADTDHRR